MSKLSFYGIKKPHVRKEPSSSMSSVQLADITENMRSDYSEDLNALLNPNLKNEVDPRFITETSSSSH
jgi:hypothetical protein